MEKVDKKMSLRTRTALPILTVGISPWRINW